ncbi:hypothetical protein TNCV_135971 [Trichonephila clavipes]|nr:hypothetical protein TNCV_135971 [Trichonephila clavipes]
MACFDLRGWEHMLELGQIHLAEPTPVLVLLWDRTEDILFCNLQNTDFNPDEYTQRSVLSTTQKIIVGLLYWSLIDFVHRKAINLEDIPSLHWTDSSTALYWILHEDYRGTFVNNRVEEIRDLSSREMYNPADLPSRGDHVFRDFGNQDGGSIHSG